MSFAPSYLRYMLAATFTGAALATASFGAFAQRAPSSALSVSGEVVTPKVYDRTGLAMLPAVTQTVSFLAGGSPQTRTYTGAPLWNVLGASTIVTNPAVRNDILRKVVVATGTDGYAAVFAAGEISPNFGARPYLVAYDETIGGVTAPIGADGFARVTAPGDVRGGRYVSNVESIEVKSAYSAVDFTGGGVSTSFSVLGAVGIPGTMFDLEDLQALPSVLANVSFLSGGTLQNRAYRGVSLWELLSGVGILTDPSIRNDLLRKYVVATGTDGYQAVFSLGELAPNFGNQPNLIAFAEVVGGVEQQLGSDGFARLVVPGDLRGGRYVSNLVSLEIYDATAPIPEPETWAMLAAGLALLTGVARRQRAATR